MWWCQQAKDRGLLLGDLNAVRGLALDLCVKIERVKDKNMREMTRSRIESIVDVWMALEHPSAYEEKERRRTEEEANRGSNQFNLLAPDMAGMLDELRRMASIDSAEDGE